MDNNKEIVDNERRNYLKMGSALLLGSLIPSFLHAKPIYYEYTDYLENKIKRPINQKIKELKDRTLGSGNRILKMYNIHTKESINKYYFENNSYSKDVLLSFNSFCKDYRQSNCRSNTNKISEICAFYKKGDEITQMDPYVFDRIYAIQKMTSSINQLVHVISAYRKDTTNRWMRRQNRKVAKNSQHPRGKAIDFRVEGVPLTRLFKEADNLNREAMKVYENIYSFLHYQVTSREFREKKIMLQKIFESGLSTKDKQIYNNLRHNIYHFKKLYRGCNNFLGHKNKGNYSSYNENEQCEIIPILEKIMYINDNFTSCPSHICKRNRMVKVYDFLQYLGCANLTNISGGLGFYPGSAGNFIHVDTSYIRRWNVSSYFWKC